MKVEKNKVTVYNIYNIDEDVVKTLTSILLNSPLPALNKYLESQGGRPNIVSKETHELLITFADTLHDTIRKCVS